jgi:hypothetical protein
LADNATLNNFNKIATLTRKENISIDINVIDIPSMNEIDG